MSRPIKLFYPASFLPHKSHFLLKERSLLDFIDNEDVRIYLTLQRQDFIVNSSRFEFMGTIDFESVKKIYREVDALCFLSSRETLGLPLIEACLNNLPVIAPNLPYANELLGDSFYSFNFEPSASYTSLNLVSCIKCFTDDLCNLAPKTPKLIKKTYSSQALLTAIRDHS